MSDPAPRRRLPRFSLRSLILFITLVASGTGLWYRWEPWVTRKLHATWRSELIEASPQNEFFQLDDIRWAQIKNVGLKEWDLGVEMTRDREIVLSTVSFDLDHKAEESLSGGLAAGKTKEELLVTFTHNPQSGKDAAGVRVWGTIIIHRRRPEYWWGVAWLPEFWLTVVLGVGLLWSVWRNRTSFRSANS